METICHGCRKTISTVRIYVVEERIYNAAPIVGDKEKITADWGSSTPVAGSERKADICCPRCKTVLEKWQSGGGISLEEKVRDYLKSSMCRTWVYRFQGIPVDAGVMIIADSNYFSNLYDKNIKQIPRREIIDPGVYNAEWSVKNYPKAKGSGTLKIEPRNYPDDEEEIGEIWVTDPGYVIPSNNWIDYLENTDYFKKLPEGVLLLDKQGGDGVFTVKLELTEKDEEEE